MVREAGCPNEHLNYCPSPIIEACAARAWAFGILIIWIMQPMQIVGLIIRPYSKIMCNAVRRFSFLKIYKGNGLKGNTVIAQWLQWSTTPYIQKFIFFKWLQNIISDET
jgi:hypothetical protein